MSEPTTTTITIDKPGTVTLDDGIVNHQSNDTEISESPPDPQGQQEQEQQLSPLKNDGNAVPTSSAATDTANIEAPPLHDVSGSSPADAKAPTIILPSSTKLSAAAIPSHKRERSDDHDAETTTPSTKRPRGRQPKAKDGGGKTAAATTTTMKQTKKKQQRERFSVEYKAKLIRMYEEWQRQQLEKNERRKAKKDPPTVMEFCRNLKLSVKFQTYLSDNLGGWRHPSQRQNILRRADAAGLLQLKKTNVKGQKQLDKSSISIDEDDDSCDRQEHNKDGEEGKLDNQKETATCQKNPAATKKMPSPNTTATATATRTRTSKFPPSLKEDRRKGNKGANTRESYSVAYKAKMIQEFEEWEAARTAQGKANSIKEYLRMHHLPHKYEKFLSNTAAGGWRYGPTKERILADANKGDLKTFKRVAADPMKSRSHVADMEANLLARLVEMRDESVTITSSVLRQLAKEEWNKLYGNNQANKNATGKKKKTFNASNGWVYNFIKRQQKSNKILQQMGCDAIEPTEHTNEIETADSVPHGQLQEDNALAQDTEQQGGHADPLEQVAMI